jgi:hypothetical protein
VCSKNTAVDPESACLEQEISIMLLLAWLAANVLFLVFVILRTIGNEERNRDKEDDAMPNPGLGIAPPTA